MTKYLNKFNIIVKKEYLPKNILAFYAEINNKPYVVMNDILHTDMHDFMFYSCLYFKENGCNVGKITIFDLKNKDFEPFMYARKELKKNCLPKKNIV